MTHSSEVSTLYRERRYEYHMKWCEWFEACPVIRTTSMLYYIKSEPYETLDEGGVFAIKKERIASKGFHHHSKAGRVWLNKPRLGDLFPSKELLATPDFVAQEAMALGWDMTRPVYELESWQRQCWVLAQWSQKPLSECIRIYDAGGLELVERCIAQSAWEDRQRWKLLIEAKD